MTAPQGDMLYRTPGITKWCQAELSERSERRVNLQVYFNRSNSTGEREISGK